MRKFKGYILNHFLPTTPKLEIFETHLEVDFAVHARYELTFPTFLFRLAPDLNLLKLRAGSLDYSPTVVGRVTRIITIRLDT